MNKKQLKFISYYLLQFLKSINLVIVIAIIILESTILNYKYINKQMEHTKYFELLYNDIYDQMDDILIPSGFDNSILDNTFTIEEISKIEQKVIHDFYKNINYKGNSDVFQERLNNNIDEYLKTRHLEVEDKKDLDNLVKELANVYENNLYYNDYLNNSRSSFNKVKELFNIVLTISILLLIILIIVTRATQQDRDKLSITLVTNGIIFAITYIYLQTKLSIENLFLYSKGLSALITRVFDNILLIILLVAIISIILGITNRLLFFKKVLNHKRKKKKKEEYTYEEDSN